MVDKLQLVKTDHKHSVSILLIPRLWCCSYPPCPHPSTLFLYCTVLYGNIFIVSVLKRNPYLTNIKTGFFFILRPYFARFDFVNFYGKEMFICIANQSDLIVRIVTIVVLF